MFVGPLSAAITKLPLVGEASSAALPAQPKWPQCPAQHSTAYAALGRASPFFFLLRPDQHTPIAPCCPTLALVSTTVNLNQNCEVHASAAIPKARLQPTGPQSIHKQKGTNITPPHGRCVLRRKSFDLQKTPFFFVHLVRICPSRSAGLQVLRQALVNWPPLGAPPGRWNRKLSNEPWAASPPNKTFD